MYDAIIIGAGPAGISASLYLKRANKNVLVLYSGESQLEKAHKIDNYYGFVGGVTGKELYENGIKQARELGIEVKNEEVLNITTNADLSYTASTKDNEYQASSLIFSTGNKKLKPNIDGVNDFEGKGISYCAICDGFFYRKKKLAVLGNEAYALSEAEELSNITDNITVLTNGLSAPETEFPVIDKKIKAFSGDMKLSKVVFDDGSEEEFDGVFIAQGVAGGVDFAKKLGIMTEGNNIKVDEKMKTNLPGVFSCGDVNGGLLQVSKAVYDGAEAGLSAVNYIKNLKK